MSSLVPVLSLSLLASLAIGCTGDQAYVPIGEETQDELCQQSTVRLNEINTINAEFDAGDTASYDGELEVTLFTKTEMRVDTDEVIFSVPANKIATISMAAGTWDFFTDMVFTVDVRQPGTLSWQEIALTTSSYDITWFSDIELNGPTKKMTAVTYPLCSTSAQETPAFDVPFELSTGYELRIRAFPHNGFGDLAGNYEYSVDVALF